MSAILPSPNGPIFLTEAGIETYIEYKMGFPLKHFCLFDLLNNPRATAAITDYYRNLLDVAKTHKTGMILCGLHYRASPDWGALMEYTPEALAEINIRAVKLLQSLADAYRSDSLPVLISACIGPRGDAYQLNQTLTVESAEAYHTIQIQTVKDAGADIITALTLNSVDEAIGITKAAQTIGIPVVISFTVDETSRLKTGPSLKQAIEQTDAATNAGPTYYMLNCSHPVDFEPALEPGNWITRLNGIRPNASALDKGTLCKLGHLEEGDPIALGQQMGTLASRFPHISVWGGCCGTDAVHINEIAKNVLATRS